MAKPSLAIGAAAPPFSIEAVVSRRKVGPTRAAGVPLLLVFQSPQTVDPARHLVVAVRRRHPDPTRLLVANLVDGRLVPKVMRGTAMEILANAYEQASAELPPEVDPAEHLIFLPDWSGKVFKAYGFPDAGQHIGVVLIDQGGLVYDSFQGADPIPAVLGWLENLLPETG